VCFFFSSRRRHTRFKCDWSSDVCSSDLLNSGKGGGGTLAATLLKLGIASAKDAAAKALTVLLEAAWAACKPLLAHDDVRHAWIRSEERRVGKGCRSRETPNE